jgi:hypothetical protein
MQIYIYKCTPDPMVKGKSFEKCKKEQMDVQCASAVGSFLSVWIKSYPDIVYISGMFWQKSNPDIDHWNGIESVLQ